MRLEIDDYERDLLIETLQYRLDIDKILVINDTLKDELVELLRKIEDED